MKSTFKRNKAGKVTVTFKDMTQGEALALCHSLSLHAVTSPVANDVRCSLRNTIQQSWSHNDGDQELFEAVKHS